jgi:hypothetical protein
MRSSDDILERLGGFKKCRRLLALRQMVLMCCSQFRLLEIVTPNNLHEVTRLMQQPWAMRSGGGRLTMEPISISLVFFFDVDIQMVYS